MIILIDDDSISGALSDAQNGVISETLAAMRAGNHRVLVSPKARRQLEEANPALTAYAEWAVIHSGWIEGQAAARDASRIIALTDDNTKSGKVEGNRYYVHLSEVAEQGILREPTFVMESMATDARLMRAYMPVRLQMSQLDFDRVWRAKAEQGGGSTIATYVKRHVDDPNPIVLLLDRDSAEVPTKNSTADKCYEALVSHGVYPSKAHAMDGGFSEAKANISVHTLNAWAIENLVFPHVMELFFAHVAPANGHGDTGRKIPLVAKFPNFPVLNEAEAVDWLNMKFKKSPLYQDANIFDSSCIDRLLNWVEIDRENRESFLHALKISMATPPFEVALTSAIRDIWSVGLRLKSL